MGDYTELRRLAEAAKVWRCTDPDGTNESCIERGLLRFTLHHRNCGWRVWRCAVWAAEAPYPPCTPENPGHVNTDCGWAPTPTTDEGGG